MPPMTQHDFEHWAEATTIGRRVFNYRFRLFGHELKGWERLKAVALQESEDATEIHYVWQHQHDGGRSLVRVAVVELDSWRSAHKRLRDTLDHCMRPSIPAGTGPLARIGDVNRVARDPASDVPAAVNFARGNVCVSVNSVGDLTIDVSSIADGIDRALSAPTARLSSARRQVRVVAPRSIVAKRAGRHVVIQSLSKAVSRDTWLKVVVPDGELHREGDRLVYVAPKAGARRIGAYLMAPPRAATKR